LTVLVLGESGVGKELVARGIHRHGRRANQPFVAVNCAAIPENLLESELFGHERGAFTGAMDRRIGRLEAAAGGTLFLDEIGDLPLPLQGKLLRVLQERTFERVGSNQAIPLQARIITATNRDLEGDVELGRFREDLFHRLNLATLRIPPLRKRREDIPLLARYFLSQANRELHKHLDDIEQAALDSLMGYDWPGNVRELEHLLKRSALVARGSILSVHDLTPPPASRKPGYTPDRSSETPSRTADLGATARRALQEALGPNAVENPPPDLFHRLVEQVERALIDEALRITGDNQVAASRLLGLHRTTLRKKR
jgi:transcriptional regulator with GAF, ATPase, and Fis domain